MTDDATDVADTATPEPASEGGSVFRLIYRSHSRIPSASRKTELGPLFSTARRNNKGLDITGALLIFGDSFVQTLEGDEDAVRSLYDRIERDTRHDHAAILAAETVGQRVFPRWSMAEVAADDAEPDTYLIAHQDGIAPATSRGSTPDQEQLLNTMRQAARGDAKVS